MTLYEHCQILHNSEPEKYPAPLSGKRLDAYIKRTEEAVERFNNPLIEPPEVIRSRLVDQYPMNEIGPYDSLGECVGCGELLVFNERYFGTTPHACEQCFHQAVRTGWKEFDALKRMSAGTHTLQDEAVRKLLEARGISETKLETNENSGDISQ